MPDKTGALRRLLDLAEALRQSRHDADVFRQAAEAAANLTEADAAAVLEPRGGGLIIRQHHGFGEHGPEQRDLPTAGTLSSLALARGATQAVPDLPRRPDVTTIGPKRGQAFHSAMSSPVKINDRPFAVLEVYSNRPRTWSAEDAALLEMVAAQASYALEPLQRAEERRKAAQADARRARFLAAASHDVRTPANAVNLLAELLARTAADPATAPQLPEMVKKLRANALSLSALVADVLDIARLDAGSIELQDMDFSLGDLLAEACRPLVGVARDKKLELAVMPPDAPIWLRADAHKLTRMIAILVRAAIKFSNQGRVEVSGRLADGQGAAICIRDKGTPVDAEQVMSPPCERPALDGALGDRGQRLAVLVAIGQQLLEAMGGTIGVESSPEDGTAVTMTLPQTCVLTGASSVAGKHPPAAGESA